MLEKQTHPDYTFFKKQQHIQKYTPNEEIINKVIKGISLVLFVAIGYIGIHDSSKMEEIKDYVIAQHTAKQNSFSKQSKANAFVVDTYVACINRPVLSSPGIYIQPESKLTCQVNTITIAKIEYDEKFSKEVMTSIKQWENPKDSSPDKTQQLIEELYSYKIFN